MKKKYIFIVAILSLLFSTPSWALINWGEDELNKQLKGAFNKTDASGVAIGGLNASGGIKTATYVEFRSALFAIGHYGASTQVASSSTNLAPSSLPYSVLLKNVGAGGGGADNLGGGTFLPNGLPGQVLDIIITSLGNNGVASHWIVTPITATGFTKLDFDTKGDSCTLLYVNDTIGWIVISNSGVTITTPVFSGN